MKLSSPAYINCIGQDSVGSAWAKLLLSLFRVRFGQKYVT